MPYYPILKPAARRRLTTAVFAGLDRRDHARDGVFYDTKNLTTGKYPLLAVRNKRGTAKALIAPGGLIEKKALAYVDNGTLYFNDLATPVTGLSAGEKQLVSMGAYVVVFPDKIYYNTENGADYGSLEASYTSLGDIAYSLCHADGTPYESVQVSDEAPADASVDVWISTAGGTAVAMSWSASYGGWVELGTVYTKLSFTTQGAIPALFSEGDGVTVSGSAFDQANGEKILYAVGGSGETGAEEADWIVLVGLLENAFTQTEGAVTIERKTPTLDYVCEAQNRLWGCFYGVSGGQTLNEIYCCALGDFKNWRQYRGLSTDSWTASVGSDGQWTGAVNYLGSPVFFKENRIHRVGVSSVGAHSLSETVCRGVQKGSHKSLVVVNETLFYKSRSDVCAWQGGFPQSVSEALGDAPYSGAVGGTYGGRYFLSMKDGSDVWHLFVYDISKAIWMREDNLHVLQFAAVGGELYAIDAGTNKLLAMNGTTGTAENDLAWYAETGLQTWEEPDRKYLSRFDIRMKLAAGTSVKLYLEYDSSGTWVESGGVTQGLTAGTGSALLPVRPRRCDHLRMKLSGVGDAEILSIARIREKGSDV